MLSDILRRRFDIRCVLICGLLVAGCGPRAHIPERAAEPLSLPDALAPTEPRAVLARSLAPVLFLQRDEWFPLERVVAVVHPDRQIVAYHMLWRDDAHGSWIPFTVPTDQEIVWVGYDSTNAPTDVWTFWHGRILHTEWKDRGPVTIDVQWGKHGSLPRGTRSGSLPITAKPASFYVLTWIGLPDLWLGNLTRPGPWCFCKSYKRYGEFTKPLLLNERIDLVAHTGDPQQDLLRLFGKP